MINEKLDIIIGKHIMEGGKSDDDIVRFAKTIDYLRTQMLLNKRWCDDMGKKHIDDVIETADNIIYRL